MALYNLKHGYRNHVISLFHLAHLDDGKLFTINHSVTNCRFSQKSIYRMVHRVDEIHFGGQEIFDLGPGSGQPHALTGWQEKTVPKTVGTKKGASTHHQACRSKGIKRARHQCGEDQTSEVAIARFHSSWRKNDDDHL